MPTAAGSIRSRTASGSSRASGAACPATSSTSGCNYRKDLFDANSLKPFDTWDDVLKGRHDPQGEGQPDRDRHQPEEQRRQQLLEQPALELRRLLRQGGRQDPGHQLARDEGGRQVRPRAVQEHDDERGVVLGRHRQQPDAGVRPASWIQNPISSLRTIEKDNPELAKKIYISNTPAGPKGRFASVSVDVWGIMNWSKNQAAAKALLDRVLRAPTWTP